VGIVPHKTGRKARKRATKMEHYRVRSSHELVEKLKDFRIKITNKNDPFFGFVFMKNGEEVCPVEVVNASNHQSNLDFTSRKGDKTLKHAVMAIAYSNRGAAVYIEDENRWEAIDWRDVYGDKIDSTLKDNKNY